MKIYFVGIGGSSMSALARMLAAGGKTVQGSDRTASAVTDALQSEGIMVHIGHDESVRGADALVYTCGVSSDNPQLKEAAALGIPVYERAQLLGLLSLEYDRTIAIAGTHGKTTTAALTAHLLAKYNPTLHIGAQGSSVGGHGLLITEACEYKNSFLTLKPDIAVVLNVECDHPDFYRTPASLNASFAAFSEQVREGGVLYVHESAAEAVGSLGAVTFGASGDYAYGGAEFDHGCASFDVYFHGEKQTRLQLNVAGAHMISNALVAAAVARGEGVSWEEITERVKTFEGVERRWQRIGQVNGADVMLDYAHHPTQIRAVLDIAQKLVKKPLVVFQPHTYSRTRALFSDYVDALSHADYAIVTRIYAAREDRDPSVSGMTLAAMTARRNGRASFAPTFCDAANEVKRIATPDHIVLILGAGDVTRVGEIVIDSCSPQTT